MLLICTSLVVMHGNFRMIGNVHTVISCAFYMRNEVLTDISCVFYVCHDMLAGVFNACHDVYMLQDVR